MGLGTQHRYTYTLETATFKSDLEGPGRNRFWAMLLSRILATDVMNERAQAESGEGPPAGVASAALPRSRAQADVFRLRNIGCRSVPPVADVEASSVSFGSV